MTTTTLAAETGAATATATSPAPSGAGRSCLHWGLAQRLGAAAVAGTSLWIAVLWALGGPA